MAKKVSDPQALERLRVKAESATSVTTRSASTNNSGTKKVSDPQALERLRVKAGLGSSKTTYDIYKSTKPTSTKKTTEKKTTTKGNNSPLSLTKAITDPNYSRNQVTNKYKENQGNKLYSETVKYLQDSYGLKGASGIMTEQEWRRRNDGGTYEEYLVGVIAKHDKGYKDRVQEIINPAPITIDTTKHELFSNPIKDLQEAHDKSPYNVKSYDVLMARTTSKDDFNQISKYSPLKPKTDAELEAEGYQKKDGSKYWYKMNLGGTFTRYYGEDSKDYIYINDPSSREAIDEEHRQLSGIKGYEQRGLHTLTEEEKAVYNYLYNQDRQNGTDKASKFIDDILPMLQKRAQYLENLRLKGLAEEYPFTTSVYSFGTNLADAYLFPTKLLATASGTYEENEAILNKWGNETSVIRGTVSKDMPWLGRMLYGAGMSIGDQVTAYAAGGGSTNLFRIIMGSSVGSSVLSQEKANGASDGRALTMALSMSALSWAVEKMGVEALLSEPKSALGYWSKVAAAESLEEGVENIGGEVLDGVVSAIEGNKNYLEKRIDYLVQNEGYTEEDAFLKAMMEDATEIGEDMFVGALAGGGMAGGRVAPNVAMKGIDAIVNPIDPTKYPISTPQNPIATTPQNPTTDNNHSSDFQSFEGVEYEHEETAKERNQRINELFGIDTEVAQKEAEANEAAYEAGRHNVPRESVNLATPEQEEAYNEGRKEYIRNMGDESKTTPTVKATSTVETTPDSARKTVTEPKSTPSYEALQAMSEENEPITADEVRRATMYGEEGSKLVADIANREGVTLDQAVRAVDTAYLAGASGLDRNKATFYTDTQKLAFEAGVNDRQAQNKAKQEQAKNATVYETGFTENEYSKQLDADEREMFTSIARDLKMDIEIIDKIIAYYDNGKPEEANASHGDGEMRVSSTSELKLAPLAIHEAFHRMRQLDPEGTDALMNFLYESSEQTERGMKLGGVGTSLFEKKSKSYSKVKGMNTIGVIEEIAAEKLQTPFPDAKAFNQWRASLDSNPQMKTRWQKFIETIKQVFEDLWAAITNSKMSPKAKRAAQAEIEQIKSMLTDAYKGAMQKADTKSAKNLEIKTNEEYNGNISYSLYADEVIFSSRYNKITQTQDIKNLYNNAKNGDVKSAYELISYLLREEDIDKVKSFGNDVHLLPVVGAEGTSTNVLPKIIAEYMNMETGQNIFNGIYKEKASDSRKTSTWGRMKENYPSFTLSEKRNIKKSDVAGKKFVLIDDNSTTGRTFVGLKNFIEENDGVVIGYYALTTGQDQSEKIITTDETWNELIGLGLDEVKKFAREEGVKREISKEGLTERESQELVKQFEGKNADSRRGRKNVDRSGRSGKEIQTVRITEAEDGNTEGSKVKSYSFKDSDDNTLTETADINKLSTEERNVVDALGKGAEAITNKSGDMLIATNKDKSTILYSLKTYKDGGKEKLEKALKANGHTEEEINETLSYVDDAADYLTILAAGYAKSHNYTALANHLIADVITNVKTGKQVISAIVNNGEYPVNIDLALICKKRVAYMNLMNRLIEDGIFDKVNYGGEAIAKVNDLLRTDGFETACLGCFVESRRLQFQSWAETIVSEWNAEVDKRTKNAGNFNFADGEAKLTDAELDALTEELKNAGKKNAQGNLNLGQGSVQTKMGRLLDKVPSLQKHLTVADLLTPNGLTALRAYDSNLFSIVKSRYGAASPKIVQDYNPYASEIAMITFSSVKNITSKAVKGADAYRRKVINEMGGKPVKQKGETNNAFKERKAEFNAKVEDEAIRRYLYDIGGARIQSFSDFMIENVFDYIQIFADLSAKRLPLHGYTKEIIALRLFGMTGAKWNGSWIAHVDRDMGKENAGLLPASEAKNGNAILVHTKDGDFAIGFDDYARHKATNKKTFIQSIGMKDMIALQLDPRYSPYVGSITIGVSDNQILAMLDSPFFRFVIPYHSSGMLPQFAKLVGVDLYNDYTDYQNTTVKQFYDVYGKPCATISGAKVDTSYNFNAEVQKTGDAKKAADNYLKWCAEKHPVYDDKKKRIGYATFKPKFSDSPYGTDFSKHENYYKLLEDFNSYDNITEKSAVQGAVTMNFPSEQNRLTASEMEAYKERLRETGIFSEAEIEKYSKIADKTFKELIADEVKGRAEYQQAQSPKWENTVKNVEQMLLNEHGRATFSLKEGDDLNTKDRKELLDIIEHLKGEFEVTKFAKIDPKKLAKMTKDILKEYSSKADFDETFKEIDELYQYMANGEDGHPAVWEDVYNRAYNVALNIMENSLVTDDGMYQDYKHLRNYLRNTPMKFDGKYDSVPSSYENFRDFYRSNFGRLKFTKDGMSIDAVYQELSSLYPEFFDGTEQTDSASQLERITEVLDEMRPTEVNPYSSSEIKEGSTYLANDLISRFFDIPQAKPTFADKAERRLAKQKLHDANKLDKLREKKNARINELIEKHNAKTKEQLDKLRQDRDIKVEKERAKRRDTLAKMSESQKAKVLRARITRHTGELSQTLRKATDKKHIPPELENAVLALLYNINLESGYEWVYGKDGNYHRVKAGTELGAEPTKKTLDFLRLKEVYADIAKNNDYNLTLASELVNTSKEDVTNIFDKVMKLSDKNINDMTSEELTKVWDCIRLVEHSIRTADKMFAMQKWESLTKTAKAFEKSVATRRTKNLLRKHYSLDLETPITFFSHFGEAGLELYEALRNAQDNGQVMIDELSEIVEGIVSLEEVQKANKDIHKFTTAEGKNLTLTTAQVMDIYLLYNREQGRKHLLYDPDNEYFGKGIRQPEIKNKKIGRGTENIRLTKADIGNIVSILTESDKAIADKMQQATLKLAEWGNKASMEVFGYEKFNDPDYWTIKSAPEGTNKSIEKNKNIERSIKNMGSAKAPDANATNALEIGGIFDVFNQHASDMICYSSWLAVVEDATKLYNFTLRDEAGNKTDVTFQDLLNKYAGNGGSEYYENLLTDIQNGIGTKPDTRIERIYTKLYGATAKAKVAFKLTVVAQQPMAVVRAANVINPTSIIKATVKGGVDVPVWAYSKAKKVVKKDSPKASEWYGGWQRALKYAPIAARKAVGGYEINSNSSGLESVMYQPKTKKGKAIDALKESPLWAAGKADEITWGVIWNACEFETSKKTSLEKGSDAYYKEVAKLFNKVINETQVVDGVLQRSQIMRSSSGWIKPLTAFKGEPIMGLNTVIRAYDRLRYETDHSKRGKAIKGLGRAVTVFAANAIFTAFARSLAVGLTGEDDEEYWEKVWKSFSGIQGDEETWFDYVKNISLNSDVANNINPLSWMPVASEIMSKLQGYDVERLDVGSIIEFVEAGQKFIDSLDGEGKNTIAYATRNLLFKFAELTGYSPYNLVRDIEGAVRTSRVESNDVKGLYEMEKWRTKPASNTSKYIDILYKAYSTDNEAYEYIYDDLIKSGVDAEKIQSGMETRMKKAEGVEKSSDLSKRYMSPDDEKKYDNNLNKIKSNKAWKSANAKQRKNAEADLYNILTSTSKEADEIRAKAKENGLDETEYVLWQLAKEMADKPTDKGEYGTYTGVELADALAYLDVDDDTAWDMYLSSKDYEEGRKARELGIDAELYARTDYEMYNIKADYIYQGRRVNGADLTKEERENAKLIKNSREKNVVDYLNTLDLTDREWLYLYGTEYDKVKKRTDYINYFGRE